MAESAPRIIKSAPIMIFRDIPLPAELPSPLVSLLLFLLLLPVPVFELSGT